MKKVLMFLLLPFMGIFASDHEINVEVTGVVPQMTQTSHFEVDYRIVNDIGSDFIIINPRIRPLGNGNINMGLGLGARSDFDYGMFGFHLACDYSYTHEAHNMQVVPSLEFMSSKWLYSFNAYMPIKNFSYGTPIGQIVQTHRYFDQEIVYKWRHANLSFSHNFDIETLKNGFVGKVSKDFGALSLAISGGQDGHHGKHVKLALVYNLPSGSSKDSHRRIGRCVGTVYDCKVLQVRKSKKLQSTITPITISKPSQEQIKNTLKKAAPATPPPQETHWYDFFLKGRSD